MKLFVLLFLVVAVVLGGCTEPEADYRNYSGGQLDDPNTTYYNTGSPGPDEEVCGGYNEACCEWFGTDAYGYPSGGYYCDTGLECIAETCVEGYGSQAYDRTNGWS